MSTNDDLKSFTLTEKPDLNGLNKLWLHNEIYEEDRSRYYDYYNSLNDEASTEVEYIKKYKYGRYFTSGMNACVMWNKSKSTLFGDTLYDVDLINAHFNILKYILDNECDIDIETPYLDEYLERRDDLINNFKFCEKWLEKHNLTYKDNLTKQDVFKLYFIIILFGGTEKTWRKSLNIPSNIPLPDFAKNFQDEFREIAKRVIESDCYSDIITAYKEYSLSKFEKNDLKKRKEYEKKNLHNGSYLSAILQDKETKIMEEVKRFLNNKKNIEWSVYCYDGFMISKEIFNHEILNEINNLIGIKYCDKIKFIIKDFKAPLELTPDKYIQIDYKYFNNEHFDLINDYTWKKEYFENFFCKLKKPLSIMEMGDEIQLHKINQMEGNFRELICKDPVTFKDTSFVGVWLKDTKMKTYTQIVFTPPPDRVEYGAYNLWKGFPIEETPFDKNADTTKIWKHFKYLSNHDKKVEDYLIKWLAHIVQFPAIKPNTAILLKGNEGAGKSVYAEMYLKHILGGNRITITSKIDMILGLNAVNEGKLLTVLNEASGAETHKKCETLKDYITQTVTTTKKLYHDPIDTVSRDRLIFTTNNLNSIPATKDNRRWVIVQVSNALKGNHAYFKELFKDLNNLTIMRKFYEELKNIDLSEWEPEDFPITELAMDIYELNENVYDEFGHEVSNLLNIRNQFKIVEDCYVVSAGDLYSVFREWWDNSGRQMTNIPTYKKFGVNFKDNKKVKRRFKTNGLNTYYISA